MPEVLSPEFERGIWCEMWARLGTTVPSFCAAAILHFLFFMKLYYTREMPYEGLDASALYDILYARRDMILGWFH